MAAFLAVLGKQWLLHYNSVGERGTIAEVDSKVDFHPFLPLQSLVWNFVGSVFAACTFNFGPHAITVPHLDFGNLSWGWCAITALGRFNPDLRGHLVLWDLKLII
jgi:hypothetical protein